MVVLNAKGTTVGTGKHRHDMIANQLTALISIVQQGTDGECGIGVVIADLVDVERFSLPQHVIIQLHIVILVEFRSWNNIVR